MKGKDEKVQKNNQIKKNLKGICQTNNEVPHEEQTKSAELLMYHTVGSRSPGNRYFTLQSLQD